MLDPVLTLLSQRPAPSWGASYVPPHQRPYGQSPLQHLQAHPAIIHAAPAYDMDPEASDSDVSATGSDTYRASSPPAIPAKVPLATIRLESSDAVDNRLRELTRVEDRNFAKLERLKAKRQRMDDRTMRKREIQDRKIKAIMDARQRRDNRIAARRAREDAEFKRVDEQLEEEEMSLRRRLKRLKRGQPPDESPVTAGRSISTASTSPPGPAYSTIPPPAKRHQSNPPGQNNSPMQSQLGGVPPQPTAQAPSYSFYQGGPKPYSVPYHSHSGSAYSTVPPPPSSHATPAPVPSQAPNDRSPYGVNGRPASPLTKPPQSAASSASTLSTAPPPRQTSSTYDTRPPPPSSNSGFATINAPPPSAGFATINARSAATPPASNSPLARSDHEQPRPTLHTASHPSETTGKSSSANSTPAATGKRTPSTTHPYQMSEAFANRHHHCERVDDLNRGIWTSHGPGGTQDHPTGPPTEMYLRCNHDNCRRIDWRTVHGLQCHIVKSHEQPKGTIGSLEKALDRYGVPVKEVEQYEREHGEGTGGSMADPKNLKIKNKTREQAGFGGRKSTPGSYGIDPNARPAGYKPSPNASPTAVHAVPRFAGSAHSPVAYPMQSAASDSKGPTAASAWSSVNNSAYGPPRPPVDTSKQLQGDAVMKDAPAPTPPPPKAPEAGPHVGERRPYDFTPRPFEYPPRPHPPTPQSEPRSPTAVNKPTAPSTSAGELQSTPAQVQRWGVATESKTLSPAWGSRPLQNIEPPSKQETQSEKPKDIDTVMGDATPEKPADPLAKPNQPTAVAPPQRSEKPVEPAPSATASAGPAADAMDVDAGEKKDETTESKPAAAAEKSDAGPKEPAAAGHGPASGTRSAQSPLIANKPLSAPTSAKRMSRRSSMARKLSGDSGDGRMAAQAPVTVAAPAPAPAQTDVAAAPAPNEGVHRESEKIADKNAEKEKERDGVEVPPPTKEDGADDEGDGESITVASRKQKDEKENLKELEKMEPRTPPRRAASGRYTRKRTLG